MRLLMITQDFPPVVGGIQTYAFQLAERFVERCEAFGVIAPGHPDDAEVDRACAYPVHRVPVPSDWMRVAVAPWLMAVALKGRYDTVFLAQWYTGAAANMARSLGAVGRVFSAAHGQEILKVPIENEALGRLYTRHQRDVLRGLDGVFPVSRYTGDLLVQQGVRSNRIHVATNGTNPERFKLDGCSDAMLAQWRRDMGLGEGPQLLTVCRLVQRKGIDLVLRMLPALAKEIPDVVYAVVGGGPEREALERLADELGVADRVRFLGRLDERDLLMAYYSSNIFVMPARMVFPSVEGFGLVFREANACGKPVIGTRTGGIPDAIEHGVTGLIVEPDDLEGLTEAALELLRDPERARAMGEAGRTLVETRGTWGHVADLILDAMERSP